MFVLKLFKNIQRFLLHIILCLRSEYQNMNKRLLNCVLCYSCRINLVIVSKNKNPPHWIEVDFEPKYCIWVQQTAETNQKIKYFGQS